MLSMLENMDYMYVYIKHMKLLTGGYDVFFTLLNPEYFNTVSLTIFIQVFLPCFSDFCVLVLTFASINVSYSIHFGHLYDDPTSTNSNVNENFDR